MDAAAPVHARAALQSRDFRNFVAARFAFAIGIQMQAVAIGWHVYALTGRALDLGFVGLAQFLPSIGLALVTGHVSDRFDRRRVMLICYASLACCATALAIVSGRPDVKVSWLYAILVMVGVFRAFAGPASQSLVPHLVPTEHFTNAVTWNSSLMQMATIVGPALGGIVYGWGNGPRHVYVAAAVLMFIASGVLATVRARTGRMEKKAASWSLLVAGIRYVWEQKIVLGSISLDLFAVLLGGATALLPIYARDILHTGPLGLGLLRSAPAVGAASMAFMLAHRPLTRRAGVTMLICVGLFGVATIVFGLSHNLTLSLAALVVLGASDMVSVVVRLSLVQLATPPPMRGRVSAVNMVFINASNELGEFESGITAAWFGAVASVVLGGVGTLLVVLLWAWLFPQLRRIDRVEDAAV